MAGIDVKMGVSGLSEFKNNLNAAKNSLKTMDAQLELTEKEFKATGDAEKYMQDKSVELNAKLEMQKATLKNAEGALQEMIKNGVDKGSKAFQDMQREVLNAKSAMLDTKNEIDGLGKEAEDAAEETGKMNTQLENIGKQVSFETVHNGLKRITDGMEKAAKAAYKVGKAVVQEVLGAGSWADDLLTTSSVLGVEPEELQRMQKTANLIDTDAETIIKARQKLNKGIGKESKNTLSALEMLGIGSSGDPEDIFWKAGEAIMNLADETEQEAYANDLFGKSWHDLVPLFTAGREEYEKMNASWKVLSDEQLSSLGKMDDEYQKLKTNIEELKMEALSQFAEPMAQAMETVNEAIGKFSEWIQSDEGKAFADSVIGKVKDALMWLTDPANIDTIKGAAITIGGAWAAMKVGEGVTSLLQLISGLKGLAGGAGGAASAAASAGSTIGTSFATGFVNAFVSAAPALASMLGITAIAITPALVANAQDEKRWAKQYQERMEAAEQLTGPDKEFMQNSAKALNQVHAPTGDALSLLMGMNDRGTIEKAKLLALLAGKTTSYGNNAEMELLRLWESGGEGWDQGRTDALLTTVTDSYTKMSQVADELSGGGEAAKQSSSEMIQAAGTLEGMPGQVEAAILRGMSNIKIFIDGATAGRVITPYVGTQMGGLVASLSK